MSLPRTVAEVLRLHIDYKHSRIKQYHKKGRALRTETTINDPHGFAIGKRLSNLPAFRRLGFQRSRVTSVSVPALVSWGGPGPRTIRPKPLEDNDRTWPSVIRRRISPA